jgi:hypothetical protein
MSNRRAMSVFVAVMIVLWLLALGSIVPLPAARAATRMASSVSSVTVRPSPTAPGDSAIVVATWGRGCDLRGCPDQYEALWSTTRGSIAHTVTVPRDSVTVPWPAWGDSLLVAVSVRSQRRGAWSSPSLGSAWLRRPDAPPPAPDSLRVVPDSATLAAAAAWRDSFPEALWTLHSATGWQYGVEGADSLPLPSWASGLAITPGYWTTLCGVAQNRYTGERALLVPRDLTEPTERAEHITACRAVLDRLATQRDA